MEINREGMVENVLGEMQARKLFGYAALLQNDYAERLVELAEAGSALMEDLKREMFEILEEYEDKMSEYYGAGKASGKSGRMELESIPCKRKVKVEVYRQQRTDGSIIAAQSLVREILDDLTDDLEPWVGDLLKRLLQMDDGIGTVSVTALKSAKKCEVPHPKWPLARQAIEASIRTVRSRRNILFYRADEPRDYARVPMNFSELGGGQ
ncbi:hypothetical protein HK16_10750 [Acetobacter senegalensis]|uniref:DUF3164 family protein n=2 Tax=Acetobacter TaxID=434 RepID=A0A252EIV2_9PROT|nr:MULTISPECIES: DUF3164 family protein [Acetobacter]ATJ89403.1 DUF3164 domain-containing protein [Acetobacter tropicalis]OUL66347.1 hypothetical protein HK16_10750 [Acetobacter senegalensis]